MPPPVRARGERVSDDRGELAVGQPRGGECELHAGHGVALGEDARHRVFRPRRRLPPGLAVAGEQLGVLELAAGCGKGHRVERSDPGRVLDARGVVAGEPRGVHGRHVACHHPRAARTQHGTGLREQRGQQPHVAHDRRPPLRLHHRQPRARGLERGSPACAGVGVGLLLRRADHGLLIGLAEGAPVGHARLQREAVGQCQVQRLAARVGGIGVVLVGAGRVHRRPAVLQALQRDALHALLVDDGEEAVLHIQPRARDLVDEHALRAPHRSGRLHEAQLPALVGQRVAHEVVEVHERGVVVPPGEAQRHRQALQQQRLAAAVHPDQQQRAARGQRGQHHRLERGEAHEAEARDQVSRRRGRWCG